MLFNKNSKTNFDVSPGSDLEIEIELSTPRKFFPSPSSLRKISITPRKTPQDLSPRIALSSCSITPRTPQNKTDTGNNNSDSEKTKNGNNLAAVSEDAVKKLKRLGYSKEENSEANAPGRLPSFQIVQPFFENVARL